jgi:hypothetical protein
MPIPRDTRASGPIAAVVRELFRDAANYSHPPSPRARDFRSRTVARLLPFRDREARMGAQKIQLEQHSIGGLLWFAGWLFTIGFLKLTFWKGALALIVWPYFIGVAAALRF